MKNLTILAIILVLTICGAARLKRQAPFTFRESRQISTQCTDPSGAKGTCTSLYNCKPYLSRLKVNPVDNGIVNFIRRSSEVCRRPQPIVCCPIEVTTQSTSYKLPTPADGCGVINTTARKIIGGQPALPGSWPWIALLGYLEIEDPSIKFRCGGTLITSRHVLTAAHCNTQGLKFVRLGEHNLATDKEANHIDVDIKRIFAHPNFERRTGRNDIAVIYMERDVQFTNTIKPVCLPYEPNFRNKNYVRYNPFIAGWGSTNEHTKATSDILYELQIPILANPECQKLYYAKNALPRTAQFDDAYLCAGILAGKNSSCFGDSGGPLTIAERINSKFYYYLLGVTSFSIGCAEAQAPGIYTKVQYFIDWIQERIAEPI